MYGAYTFDLEVVRGPEGEDEETADEEERPGRVELFDFGHRARRCCRRQRCR